MVSRFLFQVDWAITKERAGTQVFQPFLYFGFSRVHYCCQYVDIVTFVNASILVPHERRMANLLVFCEVAEGGDASVTITLIYYLY